jgi:hypothetical protein
MTLTFKLGCNLIALLCFAISVILSRAFYTHVTWGWGGAGFIAAGLFFHTLGETFG